MLPFGRGTRRADATTTREVRAWRRVTALLSRSFTGSSPLWPRAASTSATSAGQLVGSTARESPGSNVMPLPPSESSKCRVSFGEPFLDRITSRLRRAMQGFLRLKAGAVCVGLLMREVRKGGVIQHIPSGNANGK